ncbi:MAG: hypothetical protein DRP63_03925 [Planctomycetota bacterium]|nr:MAG: hypothetical protein DRP63_03925 [Planctomycetota bacterium]
MKAKLLLADAAVGHPDGTFSLLRGGINRVEVPPNRPASLAGALLIRIEATPSEKGEHTFKLVCIDEDGRSILPDMTGKFSIPDQGGSVNIVIKLQVVFPRLGRYTFAVSVDGQELDVWLISAVEKASDKK